MKTASNLIPATIGARGKSAGRLGFAFGRRFYILLLAGLVWLGPAWSDAKYVYVMLAWDAAVMCLWLADLLRLPKPEELEIRRVWHSALQLSGESRVELELMNRGGCGITAQMQDDAPQAMRDEIPTLELEVDAGSSRSAEYKICPRQRGDATFGEIFFRYQSGWGVAERWASAAMKQTIRIYPNLEESKKDTIFLIRSRQIALEKRHKHLPGHGREFESLREYRETDEWRDISWSATARRGKLISRSYQIERSQTVWLVLDAGRLLRTRVENLSKLDYAVGAALSLAQVALYSGDKVAMLAYGRRVQQRVPAGRGAQQVRSLLEALAQVKGEELEADHYRAVQTLGTVQKRRSLVVWLTDLSETATTPEVVESASRLAHKHLLLFTVIGQPELRTIAAGRPENAGEMFRTVAAQEIVQRRDVLLRGLRQQGALTLEVDAAKLSSAVVNQYLQAKERSLI